MAFLAEHGPASAFSDEVAMPSAATKHAPAGPLQQPPFHYGEQMLLAAPASRSSAVSSYSARLDQVAAGRIGFQFARRLWLLPVCYMRFSPFAAFISWRVMARLDEDADQQNSDFVSKRL